MNRESEVVYNSDLIIRDASDAATLCVFYDRVYLPYTTRQSSLELIGTGETKVELSNDIGDWEVKYGTLFDKNVLRRLSPAQGLPVQRKGTRVVWYNEKPIDVSPYLLRSNLFQPKWGSPEEGDVILETVRHSTRSRKRYAYRRLKVLRQVKEVPEQIDHGHPNRARLLLEHAPDLLSQHVDKMGSGNRPLIRLDLVEHLLRKDITIPQIFSSQNGIPSRDILVALEAKATFRYLLPKLHVYHPTQILELRELVKDTREGFTEHLFTLVSGLEERTSHGASLKEAEDFAQSVIETKLVPDYREFQRQLLARDAKSATKILDFLGRVAKIDATMGSPKFWFEFLKACGISVLTSESEREEKLSNKFCALRFMSNLERGASRYLAYG